MAEVNFVSLINLIDEELKRGMTDEGMKHLRWISVEVLTSLSVFCQVGIAMLEMFLEKEKVRKINTEIDLKESVKKRNTCKLASTFFLFRMSLRFSMKREIGSKFYPFSWLWQTKTNLKPSIQRRATKIIAEMEGIDDNLENDKIILVKVKNSVLKMRTD